MAPTQLAIEDMRENEMAVRQTYGLTGPNIYSEDRVKFIAPMPPTPPLQTVTHWFQHYFTLSLANDSDGAKPLPIKSGDPTNKNTRNTTTDYSNKIQFAVHVLRGERTESLALRQVDDISPIPGCVAFSFNHTNYYFYPAAFSDKDLNHQFLTHVLYLIDEQVDYLASVDRPDGCSDTEYALATYDKYLDLERSADYYLYKGLEHVANLYEILSTSGGATTPQEVTNTVTIAQQMLNCLKYEVIYRKASAQLIETTCTYEIMAHRIIIERTRLQLFTKVLQARHFMPKFWAGPFRSLLIDELTSSQSPALTVVLGYGSSSYYLPRQHYNPPVSISADYTPSPTFHFQARGSYVPPEIDGVPSLPKARPAILPPPIRTEPPPDELSLSMVGLIPSADQNQFMLMRDGSSTFETPEESSGKKNRFVITSLFPKRLKSPFHTVDTVKRRNAAAANHTPPPSIPEHTPVSSTPASSPSTVKPLPFPMPSALSPTPSQAVAAAAAPAITAATGAIPKVPMPAADDVVTASHLQHAIANDSGIISGAAFQPTTAAPQIYPSLPPTTAAPSTAQQPPMLDYYVSALHNLKLEQQRDQLAAQQRQQELVAAQQRQHELVAQLEAAEARARAAEARHLQQPQSVAAPSQTAAPASHQVAQPPTTASVAPPVVSASQQDHLSSIPAHVLQEQRDILAQLRQGQCQTAADARVAHDLQLQEHSAQQQPPPPPAQVPSSVPLDTSTPASRLHHMPADYPTSFPPPRQSATAPAGVAPPVTASCAKPASSDIAALIQAAVEQRFQAEQQKPPELCKDPPHTAPLPDRTWTPMIKYAAQFNNSKPAMLPGMAQTPGDLQATLVKFCPHEVWPTMAELNADVTKLNQFPTMEPTLTVTYDGDPLQFTSFIRTFVTECHRNPRLSFTQKTRCFIKALRGTPLTLFESWLNYPDQYETMLLKFINKFFKHDRLSTTYLKALTDLTKANTTSQLTILANTITRLRVHLEAHDNAYFGQHYIHLRDVIQARLPDKLFFKFNNVIADVNALELSPGEHGREFLRYASQWIEEAVASWDAKKETEIKGNLLTSAVNPSSHFTSDNTTAESNPCAFCEGHHKTKDCRIYSMPRSDKIAIVKRHNWCFRCLQPYTSTHTCTFQCPVCQGDHHMALCTNKFDDHRRQHGPSRGSRSLSRGRSPFRRPPSYAQRNSAPRSRSYSRPPSGSRSASRKNSHQRTREKTRTTATSHSRRPTSGHRSLSRPASRSSSRPPSRPPQRPSSTPPSRSQSRSSRPPSRRQSRSSSRPPPPARPNSALKTSSSYSHSSRSDSKYSRSKAQHPKKQDSSQFKKPSTASTAHNISSAQLQDSPPFSLTNAIVEMSQGDIQFINPGAGPSTAHYTYTAEAYAGPSSSFMTHPAPLVPPDETYSPRLSRANCFSYLCRDSKPPPVQQTTIVTDPPRSHQMNPVMQVRLLDKHKNIVLVVVLADSGADRCFLVSRHNTAIVVDRLTDDFQEPFNTSAGQTMMTVFRAFVYFHISDTRIIRMLTKVLDSDPYPSTTTVPHPMAAYDPLLNAPSAAIPVIMLLGGESFSALNYTSCTLHPGYFRYCTFFGNVYAGTHDPSCSPPLEKHEDFDVNTSVSTTTQLTTSAYSTSQPPPPKPPDSDYTRLLKLITESEYIQGDELDPTLTAGKIAAQKLLQDNIVMNPETRRFTVPLLLRPDAQVPNNYRQAKAILLGQYQKIQNTHDEDRANLFRKKMQEFLEHKACHKVDTPTPDTDKAFYSTFRLVFKDSTTTPERLCMNASVGVTSLNSQIYPTPSLLPAIFKMLLLSRVHRLFVIGDISKMFLSCDVRVQDRPYCRILWKDPADRLDTPPAVFQFSSLPWGVSTSPYLASSCLRRALEVEADEPDVSDFRRQVALEVIDSVYMDDWSRGFDDADVAAQYTNEVISILQKYGFKIRKFASNSGAVLAKLPQDRLAPLNEIVERVSYTSQETTNLGYAWNCSSDSYVFAKYKAKGADFAYTPRALLSLYASIYDPLGLVACYVLTAKILLSQCLQKKLGWDDHLQIMGPEFIKKTKDWLNDLPLLANVSFPRSVGYNDDSVFAIFSDASTVGIGAHAYCISPTATGVQSHLLCSKAKVSPISDKNLSIPKLEIRGIRLATLLALDICDSLNVDKSKMYFFTDSLPSVFWGNKDPNLCSTFVRNRTKTLHEHSWTLRYIKTKMNPSDASSRGTNLSQVDTPLHRHGPDFLTQPPSLWPKMPADYSALDDMTSQLRKSAQKPSKASTALSINVATDHADLPFSADLLQVSLLPVSCDDSPNSCFMNISSWTKHYQSLSSVSPLPPIGTDEYAEYFASAHDLFHHIGKLYMFLDLWIQKTRHRQEKELADSIPPDDKKRHLKSQSLFSSQTTRPHPIPVRVPPKTSDSSGSTNNTTYILVVPPCYQNKARNLCAQKAQQRYYPKEYKSVVAANALPVTSKLIHYDLFLDNNFVLRLSGRLRKIPGLSYDEVHPILLPAEAHVTKLLALDVHRESGHRGLNTVNGALTKQYFVPHLKRKMTQVISQCLLCQMKKSKTFSVPMGDVPPQRYHLSRAFEACITDMFGWFYVRRPLPLAPGQEAFMKVWAYIYVCMGSRFIFVHVVESPSLQDFLQSFLHLKANHGQPTCLFSDNQGAFVNMAKHYNDNLRGTDLYDYTPNDAALDKIRQLVYPTHWTLSPKGSPWQQGAAESLLASVKKSLSFSVPTIPLESGSGIQSVLNVTPRQLQAVFDDLTALINDRALLPHPSEPTLIITPARLAKSRSLNITPVPLHEIDGWPKISPQIDVEAMTQIRQTCVSRFQAHLREELQKRKWSNQHIPVKVGDILMCPPSSAVSHKRALFLPGFVRKIHHSSDGQPRHLDMFIPALKTASGGPARNRLQRYDLKRLAPLELDQPRAGVRFSNTVVVHEEHVDSAGKVTHDNSAVNVDLVTKKPLPTTDNVQYCDVQLLPAGETLISPVQPQLPANDVTEQLAQVLPAESTPLADINHDSDTEDEDFSPLPDPPVHVTRAGRRVRPPSKYHDFV